MPSELFAPLTAEPTSLETFFPADELARYKEAHPEEYALIATHQDRIQDAIRLGLGRNFPPSCSDFLDLVKRSPGELKILSYFAERYGLDALEPLLEHGTPGRIFADNTILEFTNAFLSVSTRDSFLLSAILYEPALLEQAALHQDELTSWIEERFALSKGWQELCLKHNRFIRERFEPFIFLHATQEDLERMERITHSDVQGLVVKHLFANNHLQAELHTDGFWEKVRACERLAGSSPTIEGALDVETCFIIDSTLENVRSTFFKALTKHIDEDEMTSILQDEKSLASLKKASMQSDLAAHCSDNLEAPSRWEAGRALPVFCGQFPEYEEELNDILRLSGMGPVAARCVENLNAVGTVNDMIAGSYSRNVREINIYVNNLSGQRETMPGTIFHEVGHGANDVLASLPEGQALFDAYAIAAVYMGTNENSHYAESHAMLFGREDVSYVSETFAEDFRLLVEYPVLIPRHRREALETIWRILFPNTELEDVQRKTRSMYGALYAIDPKRLQRPTDCASRAKYAQYHDRGLSEEKRASGAASARQGL